jgi:hypothetical protein
MASIKQNLLCIILSLISLVFLSSCQSHEPIANMQEEEPKETIEVAILMPLTGENAVLGRQYDKLIKMGLEDGLKSYVHVTSYDGSNEVQTLAAMQKIIARKTKIILGPLYSNLTALIAQKAKAENIIVITMSNDPSLADKKLFVFGHAPLKQLIRIVNYFADNDYKNFIALLPSGQYSQTVNQVMQNIVIKQNATLARSEFYASTPESIDKAVHNVSNTVDNLNEMDDVSTKPVVYLSDDLKNLHLIFNSLHKYSLDKKAIIIGDNRIDINYPESTNLMFTGSLNIINSDVPERVKSLGVSHMLFMHAMAYDLGRMTSKYIDSKFTEDHFLAQIASKLPYIGMSGNIHFVDSIAQRDYDIIKKEDGVYSTISNNN